MATRTKSLVAVTAVAALVFSGSAAGAAGAPRIGSVPTSGLRPPVRWLPEAVLLSAAEPEAARPATTDPFAGLGAGSFAVYATGTAYHTDAELSGEEVGADVDLATSDAAYSSTALSALTDELGRPVFPQLADGSSFGRGRALSVIPPDALGPDVDAELLKPAEAKAPPSGAPVKKQTQVNLEPAVKADALQAEASARAVVTGCVLGSDLARGAGSGDDTDIADLDPKSDSKKPLLSISSDDPPRAVTQSVSRAHLVPMPGSAGRFGVTAETRQTVAPVTFTLPGAEDQPFTIELAGEWVLRATSDGTKGSVSFGPEGGRDDTPMLRLIQGKDVVDEVGLRELGGKTGLYVDGRPVGELRIGESPRARGGKPASPPLQTATKVLAAVDVVSVRLFDPPSELRVGHMEVGLAVPAGGVQCPGIGLTTRAEPASVRPGERFSRTLTVSNPNDCVLDKVAVVDISSATPGVTFHVVTTTPNASSVKDGELSFDGIGPIPTGGTRTLQIDAEADGGSAPGTVTNRATANGTCGSAPVTGATESDLSVGGSSVPTGAVSPPHGFAAGSRTGSGGPAGSSILPAPALPATAPGEMPLGRSGSPRSRALAGTGGPVSAALVMGMSLLGGGALLRRRKGRSAAR